MFALKAAVYALTIAGALFFAFWELRVRRQLTDERLGNHESVSDIDSFYESRRDFERERILRSLPPEALFKYRAITTMKFLLAVALVIEVFVLQR
jgi:hypothetical protein